MYISSLLSQGLIHTFYREISEDMSHGWDIDEIADLYTLVKNYYKKLTNKVAKNESEMVHYFSYKLNIPNVSLLKIARSIERNQHKKGYNLSRESLLGIGA